MNGPDLVPEQQNLIVISTRTIRQAEKRISSCEQCCPVDAEIPFDWILDEITDSDSTTTDYIMENPAIGPQAWTRAGKSLRTWKSTTPEQHKFVVLPEQRWLTVTDRRETFSLFVPTAVAKAEAVQFWKSNLPDGWHAATLTTPSRFVVSP